MSKLSLNLSKWIIMTDSVMTFDILSVILFYSCYIYSNILKYKSAINTFFGASAYVSLLEIILTQNFNCNFVFLANCWQQDFVIYQMPYPHGIWDMYHAYLSLIYRSVTTRLSCRQSTRKQKKLMNDMFD